MTQSWRAFRALDANDRRLVVEAAALLAVVSLGVRSVSFASLRRGLNRCARRRRGASRATPGRISWALAAAGRRFPARPTCLVAALAADVMLRRRGYPSEVHFGVRKRPDRSHPLDAHAWVESDGGIVVGGVENLTEYQKGQASSR